MAPEGWCEDAAQATDFPNTTDAILYCLGHKLKDVRVAMLFGDPTLDVYFRPFTEQTRAESEGLRGENGELRERQRELREEMRAEMTNLARAMQKVPMVRKKKRQTPPPEDSPPGVPDG